MCESRLRRRIKRVLVRDSRKEEVVSKEVPEDPQGPTHLGDATEAPNYVTGPSLTRRHTSQ